MSITQNACFIITTPNEQIYAIAGIDDSQLKWLEVLSEFIPDSKVSKPVQPKEGGIHLGVFTYSEFRTFLKEVGYGESVHKTDALYQQLKD